MRRWGFALAAATAVIAACVGENPATTTSTPDAGALDASPGDASAPDAAAGSCAGQPFGAAEPVTFASDAGAKTVFLDLRVVGTNAYFGRSGLESDSIPFYLYQGTFAPGSPPTVTGATSIATIHDGESDFSPAVAADGSFIFYTHGNFAPQTIWSAAAADGGFPNGASAGVSEGTTNDADPWLAGAPSHRLYFGRGAVDGSAMRIVYADVTANGSDAPSVGTVVAFAPTCPASANDNCGKPVVTPDESTLFFATWAATGTTEYAPYEVALAKTASGAVTSATTLEPHSELGARAITWTSDDGCQVLLRAAGGGDVFYAVRTPK